MLAPTSASGTTGAGVSISSWHELNPAVTTTAAASPVIYFVILFMGSVGYFLPLMARFLISQVSAPSALEPYLNAI